MTVMAFVYDNYYCWSPRATYRGTYDDADEAVLILKGGRYENQNLELCDPDTQGWETYTWKPDYKKDRDGNLSIELISGGEVRERHSIAHPREHDYLQAQKYNLAEKAGRWVRDGR